MEYQSILLKSIEDLPKPPNAENMKISGCSVVIYIAHRVPGVDFATVFADGRLTVPSDDRSYESKTRPGSGLLYSSFIDAGPVPVALSRVIGSGHADRLGQSIVSFGDEYALSAVPFLMAVPRGTESVGIHLSSPIDVDAILRLTSLLLNPDIAESIARQSAAGLTTVLGAELTKEAQSWPMPGSFGLQVWNLDGTPQRESSKFYEGVEDSVRYSWEISALLSYGTDHLVDLGLWRRRSPQDVFNHVRTGSAFFDDHMIFVTPDCCLEMGHLPAWTRERSRYRLANYGFDSSSIFVWTVGVLRTAILSDLSKRYESNVVDLSRFSSITATKHAELGKERMRHEALIDRAVTFRDWLVEARNRALDEEATRDRADSRLINALARIMDKSSALSESLLRVTDEADRSRRDLLLASLAVALAAVQVPPFVEQFADWISKSQWLLLGISSALIGLALIVVILIATMYGRRR